MNISQDTISLLKNYASINSNIVIRSGNIIRTISPSKNIFCEATVQEDFPIDFGIYDLSKFLATISMFKDPIFEFEDTHAVISSKGSRSKVKYFYSDPENLIKSDKKMKMPPSVVNFRLESKDLLELQKASAVLGLPDAELSRKGDRLELIVLDRKDSTSHTYAIDVGECDTDADFKFLFKVAALMMIPGTYDVKVSDQKVAEFRSEDGNKVYWISLESDSTFKAGKKSYAAVG
jgi:hypothetical protein